MSIHDELILAETMRLTALVLEVRGMVEKQDGRLLYLERRAYVRMVLVGVGGALLGCLLGALVLWGCVHVA